MMVQLSAQSFLYFSRYITVLYYLNQPEAGGETAFPAADVDSFNETVGYFLLLKDVTKSVM